MDRGSIPDRSVVRSLSPLWGNGIGFLQRWVQRRRKLVGGGGLALDLNLRHSADKRQFPGSCVRPLVYVRCMTARARTAALLCVRRELYMYMYSVFFTRKASLVPRLLRPTAPLRTLRLVTCVFNRLSRALASREAAICKSSNENESHNVTKQSTQCIASHLPQL